MISFQYSPLLIEFFNHPLYYDVESPNKQLNRKPRAKPMHRIRILLADDHTLVRAGFRSLLQQLPAIEVIAETGDGQEVLPLALEHQPDVVLLDISMPGLNGLDLTARLLHQNPHIRVLILSMHANEEYVRKALRAGAIGYLLKDAADTELEVALNAAVRGQPYLSAALSKRVIEEYARGTSETSASREALTPRQREIIQLIAEGKSTKEIAYLLKVSVKTVETHRLQIMERLDIHDIPGLVRYAIRKGLISLDL